MWPTGKINRAEALQLRQEGKTYKYIANRYGVSHQRVQQIFKKMNAAGRLPHVSKPKPTRPTKIEKFWAKVDKTNLDGCWEWMGCVRSQNRYGGFSWNGKAEYAHRVSYMITYGPIPNSFIVCHKCDNPRCVRPDHLFLGTDADNMHDRDAKGRGRRYPEEYQGDKCKRPGCEHKAKIRGYCRSHYWTLRKQGIINSRRSNSYEKRGSSCPG